MAIDIKNILEIVQRKIAAVGPSTSTEDLSYLLKLAKRLDGTTLVSYDSDGSLPDPATSNERLAFITSTGQVKFNNGAWDTIASEYNPPPPPPPYSFQGTSSGYVMGGVDTSNFTTTQEFSFTSDGNSTIAGDLIKARHRNSGHNSRTDGYTAGGSSTVSYETSIEKFPFASASNIVQSASLSVGRQMQAGSSNEFYGYAAGGFPGVSTIEKFSFSSDADGAATGDLGQGMGGGAGQSSTTDGYVSSGLTPTYVYNIRKYPFSIEVGSTATVVGLQSESRYYTAGQSSTTSGYTSGGQPSPTGRIDKFSFASDGAATAVGSLSVARRSISGQSSLDTGYTSGGVTITPGAKSNIIDKFPYAAEGTATDVGDLVNTIEYPAGTQK